ncbi:MAG: hypothetical protein ACYC92_12630 [Candidatus Acidiferrales bacterium]
MGKLEVIFRIQLAYPVIALIPCEASVVVTVAATGNTIRIGAPRHDTAVSEPPFGGGEMTLVVERECAEQPGKNPSVRTSRKLGIEQDAARVFYQFFEAIRDSGLRRKNTVFTYPVVPSEDIGSNPLVKSYELEWIYDGNSFSRAKLAHGIPAIEITEEWWNDAVDQLAAGRAVPVYRSFALDAFYFAQHDPPRGIVMACAAWETSLRYYLANVASKRDPAYDVASEMRSIPTLYRFAREARGGAVFYDWIEQESTSRSDSDDVYREREIEILVDYKNLIDSLPEARNKLLHRGETVTPGRVASDYALAVAAAIDWLFEEREPSSP